MEIKLNSKTKRFGIEIADNVQIFFEDKVEDADIPERVRDSIQERIELLRQDIMNLIDVADKDIDAVIEEFTPEELENIKSDLRYERMCG